MPTKTFEVEPEQLIAEARLTCEDQKGTLLRKVRSVIEAGGAMRVMAIGDEPRRWCPLRLMMS